MAKVLRVADGKIAIWDDASDDAPFVNPIADAPTLARVKLHSDLNYVGVLSEVDVTLNLPARSSFTSVTATQTLFAHGKAGTPLIIGQATVGGHPVALVGSIPVQFGTLLVAAAGSFVGYYGRWISVGVDATNVFATEYAVAQHGQTGGQEYYDAISVPLKIFVTDLLL